MAIPSSLDYYSGDQIWGFLPKLKSINYSHLGGKRAGAAYITIC
jgi:hypothetical protein